VNRRRGRGYQLGAYAIDATTVDGAFLSAIHGWPRYRWARAAFIRLGLHRRHAGTLAERDLGYQPRFERVAGSVLLHGYFQSERYFAAVRDILGRQIAVPPTAPAAVALAARLSGETSVAIHVRRGDYPQTGFLVDLPPGYYVRAVRLVREQVPDARLYLFSDDIQWCRERLAGPLGAEPVQIAGGTHHDDLALMARCRHHVIANSTFGWWGAWLAERPGALVVAPSRWYARPRYVERDLVPERWARVDVAP
jgi:hypothetical protein